MQKFYVGLKAFIQDPERGVLLMHKADTERDFWELPGGRIDNGESFEEALTRELKEEVPSIGSIAVGEVLGAFKVNREFPDGRGLLLLYFAVDAQLPDPIVLSDEHDSYVFYNGKGGIPEPVNPVVRELLTKSYNDEV